MKSRSFLPLAILFFAVACSTTSDQQTGQTTISKWAFGKKAAISLTYDDGSINQFRVALPIMNRLSLPATFFIITGQIPGSRYQGKFIGRPVKEIIAETAKTPTNADNFFERASAVGFLGYQGTIDYHTNAGTLYEAGKKDEAYKLIDEAYKKVRNGDFKSGYQSNNEVKQALGVTWDDIRTYAAQGHEFASHTVTHPRLAVLDDTNMVYELEKSREDILRELGARYTFSAEGPYGTEDERVMPFIHKRYPAARNRMPEPFLAEINRASKTQPGTQQNEYVQWQRGATTKTPLPLMKSWIDTVMAHDNNWLVLVIHGVDSIGYEALTHQLLEEYFAYFKKNEDSLWIATFGDVTKYMRERMNAKIENSKNGETLQVKLTHSLDTSMYNIPLTLKTYVPADWKMVSVKQGDKQQSVANETDAEGSYILYQVYPNKQPAELAKLLPLKPI